MEKIAFVIIVFLVMAPIGTNLGTSSSVESDDVVSSESTNTKPLDSNRSDLTAETPPDVPTWKIGTTWTYHEDFWTNETSGSGPLKNMTMEKRLNYTVSSIEDVEGVDTPVYNVTFEGQILEGYGAFDPEQTEDLVNFTVEEGNTTGYILQRVDDLGVVVKYEHMEYELNITDIEGFPPIYIDNINKYVHEPVVENYDFPVTPGKRFWANNTRNVTGYNEIFVEGEEGDIRNRSYDEDYNRTVDVSDDTALVEVPSGSYETSLLHETFEANITGREENASGEWENQSWEDSGFRKRYYDSEVQNYVMEVYNTSEYAPKEDWVRVLEDYNVPENPNSLSVEPSHAAVGETVKISGNFPDHTDEDFTLNIPMGDGQILSTKTDSSGHFSEEFEVPEIEDNTPSPGSFGSVGVIAQMDDDPKGVYHVSTLSIVKGPIRPKNPSPEDGATDIDTTVELGVDVGHHEGVELTVDFYEASNDELIGSDTVEAGARASTTWDDLQQGMTYQWYAEVDDGEYSSTSEVWQFTTFLEYILTVNIEGEGTIDPEEGTHAYDAGEEVTVNATPSEGWYFEEWTGDVPESEGGENITITMDRNRNITAHFARNTYTLEIDTEGEGSIEVDGEEVETPYTGEYEYGTEVEIEAIPEGGWYFDIWTGDYEGIEKNINITMDGDKDFTANFGELLDYLLTINIEGEGTTIPRQGSHPYNESENVTVVASPDVGWYFDNWTGDYPDGERENETITITMDENKTITAHFAIHTYDLTINIDGEGSTDPEEGAHTYDYGTEVNLIAMSDIGWFFSHWSGDTDNIIGEAVTDSEIVVNITSDISLTAVFEEGPLPPGDPSPEGGGTVGVTPELSVYVEHRVGDDMDVSFYDASDDNRIGTDKNVENGSYASIVWDGLEHGKVYEWYACSSDGTYTATSETWNFTTVGLNNLTIHIEGEGSTNPSSGIHEYAPRENVSIVATPEIGWYLDGWTGDHTGTEEEITITMDEDKEITANFEEYVTLTVTGEGEGSVEVDGEEKTLPYFGRYRQDSVQTIEAIAEEGWYFEGWTGDHEGENEEINITMDDDKRVQATFEEYVTLEVQGITGEGTVHVDGEEIEVPFEKKYLGGEEVNVDLEAVPDEGWHFIGWEGIDAEDNETELKMNKDVIISTALFEEYFTLEVQGITGEGTVHVDGEGIETPFERNYTRGEEVELEAVPEEGWYLEEWKDNHTRTGNVITITMDGDKTVHPVFKMMEQEYVLNLDIDGEGNITPSEGTHIYTSGEEVTLEASPAEGWVFGRWTGDYFGMEDQITITMDSGKDITAQFQEKEKEPARFEIEITDYREDVKEGEKVTVSYTVQNTGELQDTQFIRLKADGETVDINKDITLGPKESFNGTLEWETDRAGTYELSIDSADTSVEIGTASVEEQTLLPVPLWVIPLVLIIAVVVLVLMAKGGIIFSEDHEPKTSLEDFEEEDEPEEDAESVDKLRDRFSKYNDYLERFESLEQKEVLLNRKLADKEIDKEYYDETMRRIRTKKAKLKGKLAKLKDELCYEKYERAF